MIQMRRLTEYLIQTADGPAYRSGNLEKGMEIEQESLLFVEK